MLDAEVYDFLDELEKIAKDSSQKESGTHILKKYPHLLLLSKQKNLPPLIMRMLAKVPKGITVTIDPDYKKNEKAAQKGDHQENGFYTLEGDHIHITTMNHETLAHEIGHARTADDILGKLFQNKVLYPLINWAPLAGFVGGHGIVFSHPVAKAVSLGAPFLLTVPALISEAKASFHGKDLLKEVGASEKQLGHYTKELLKAYGSYAKSVPLTALGVGAGAGSMLSHMEQRALETVRHRHTLFNPHAG